MTIDRPRQNRVTPFGDIEASTARGLFLGNRGDIHAASGGLSDRRWAVKAWICCALTSKNGTRISFDRKGTYYPLFFADEATALAAGHRPCAQCRYRDFQNFKRFWQKATNAPPDSFVFAADIDRQLHASRLDAWRAKSLYTADIGTLPDGVMVAFADAPASARLVWRGKTHAWGHAGYSGAADLAGGIMASVLTPEPLVAVLRAGYRPVVHPSVTA